MKQTQVLGNKGLKLEKQGAGEVAQWVKCLAQKHEDPSLDP